MEPGDWNAWLPEITPGTWADWIGAFVTLFATAVALYFGVRDHAKHESWKTAQRELRAFARDQLRHMDRWDEGTEEPDHNRIREIPALDVECARAVTIVDRMSPWRARRAEKVLAAIYGERSVDLARLYPERVDPNVALHDARTNAHQVRETLTEMLLWKRPDLALEVGPEPLRLRGAADDLRERNRLRKTFRKLTQGGQRRRRHKLRITWQRLSPLVRWPLDRVAFPSPRAEGAGAEHQSDGSNKAGSPLPCSQQQANEQRGEQGH